MIAIFKQFFSLALLFSLVILAAGCSRDSFTTSDQTQKPQLEIVGDDPIGCDNLGETYVFDVEVSQVSVAGFPPMDPEDEYMIYFGEMEPYSLDTECVCKMEFIRLEFDQLPAYSQITVQNENGNAVGIIGPFATPNGEAIDILQGQSPLVTYIDFDPSVDPSPELMTAGGYCIVDNISGPKSSYVWTGAYVEEAWDPDLYVNYDAIFVPMSYTTAPVIVP